MKDKLKHFVLDVDGVMTDGTFVYTAEGKVAKVFGPHDADGLKMIKDMINIQFITADHRGFEITKRRIEDDLGFKLSLVSEQDRLGFVAGLGLDSVAYMGDGYYDAPVLEAVALGICPVSARQEARWASDFVTTSKAGQGAVLDACLYLKGILE